MKCLTIAFVFCVFLFKSIYKTVCLQRFIGLELILFGLFFGKKLTVTRCCYNYLTIWISAVLVYICIKTMHRYCCTCILLFNSLEIHFIIKV